MMRSFAAVVNPPWQEEADPCRLVRQVKQFCS
jgi:hypothetical protein